MCYIIHCLFSIASFIFNLLCCVAAVHVTYYTAILANCKHFLLHVALAVLRVVAACVVLYAYKQNLQAQIKQKYLKKVLAQT